MKDALAVHRRLLEREIGHEIVRLRTTALTADDLPGALGVSRDRCLATQLFVTDPGGRAIAVLTHPGDHAPVAAMRAATGARHLRLAGPYRINALTDFAAGLICPILLPASIGVFIDRRILARTAAADIVYTPTGEKRTALAITLGDLIASLPVSLPLSSRYCRQGHTGCQDRYSLAPGQTWPLGDAPCPLAGTVTVAREGGLSCF